MKIRQLSLWWTSLSSSLTYTYTLILKYEQHFIRGREKSNRGREVGEKGEGSGGDGGGKWGEWGRELGMWYPPVHPLLIATGDFETADKVLLDDRFPFMDLALEGPLYPYFRGVKFVNEKPSPRFIKSHLHHFILPKQLREGKAKVNYRSISKIHQILSLFHIA